MNMEKQKNKYTKRVDQNIKEVKNKVVLINGVTGGIGEGLLYFLSYLNNHVIALIRNLKEGEKLKNKYEAQFKNKIDLIYMDYLDKDSIDKALESIKNLAKVDYFINVSGIYHQNYELKNSIEKTYVVNYIAPTYFITKLLKQFPKVKIVATSSVTSSTSIKKINLENNENYLSSVNKIKNKTKRYAISKHLLNSYLLYLKEEYRTNIVIAHPGVALTNLFNKKNNAYGSWFYLFVPTLMKLVFMDSFKASLSILYGTEKDTKLDKRVGPRGLFHSWGYPKIYSLSKKNLTKNENQKIYNLTKELFK